MQGGGHRPVFPGGGHATPRISRRPWECLALEQGVGTEFRLFLGAEWGGGYSARLQGSGRASQGPGEARTLEARGQASNRPGYCSADRGGMYGKNGGTSRRIPSSKSQEAQREDWFPGQEREAPAALHGLGRPRRPFPGPKQPCVPTLLTKRGFRPPGLRLRFLASSLPPPKTPTVQGRSALPASETLSARTARAPSPTPIPKGSPQIGESHQVE